MERNFDADERGGEGTEEEEEAEAEEEAEEGEEGKEGELHSEARELESMLRSFETDLNRGRGRGMRDVVDPADAADVGEDFDIDEYERAFGESLQE